MLSSDACFAYPEPTSLSGRDPSVCPEVGRGRWPSKNVQNVHTVLRAVMSQLLVMTQVGRLGSQASHPTPASRKSDSNRAPAVVKTVGRVILPGILGRFSVT